VKRASPDQRRPRDGVALPDSSGAAWQRFREQGADVVPDPEAGVGVLKEPRKGGLGVALVHAVVEVEPGGHYCRSSDAAVLLCVRIIALAASCVVCRGAAWQHLQLHGRERERTGAFLAFSLSAPHVGVPFVAVFPLHPVEFQAPFLLGSKNRDKITLGSASRAHRQLKAASLLRFFYFLRVVFF
jgi:hypothetical protein